MTPGITAREPTPIYRQLGATRVALEVDTSLYALAAIQRAAYKFTDRCVVLLTPSGTTRVTVTLSTTAADADLDALVGAFCNELLDQQLRETLAASAGPLRELIVAQAFADADLLAEDDESPGD